MLATDILTNVFLVYLLSLVQHTTFMTTIHREIPQQIAKNDLYNHMWNTIANIKDNSHIKYGLQYFLL